MSRAVMQQALEFCEFAWRDVSMNDYAFERLEQAITALRAALAEPEQEVRKCPRCWEPMLVPQRKPLTREEAIALWADKSDGPSNGEIVSFARAIERAHGIKEQEHEPR